MSETGFSFVKTHRTSATYDAFADGIGWIGTVGERGKGKWHCGGFGKSGDEIGGKVFSSRAKAATALRESFVRHFGTGGR
jgi:hypothetical protein